jgi:G protein beta subunit-like protein
MIQHRDVTSLVPTCKFQAHNKYITRVLISPDVRHLATCSADHTAKIWAVDPNAAAGHGFGGSTGLTPNSQNQLAVANGDSKAATEGQPQQENSNGSNGSNSSGGFLLETELKQHNRWVWDCAFSADSAYLVTACSDHNARLWELSSRSIIRQYNGHHRGAVCVALNDYSER